MKITRIDLYEVDVPDRPWAWSDEVFGMPLEIVSKVILRHRVLRTTQIYLGEVSETEALQWVERLHGR